MIAFECHGCGRRLKVSDANAGKKGKCPTCSAELRVPHATATVPEPPPEDLLPAIGDMRLKARESSESPVLPSWDTQQLPLESIQSSPEDNPDFQRRHPWPFDVLLYPANFPGLLNLLMFWWLPWMAMFVPIFGCVLSNIVSIYMVYYFTICVRASAAGEVRAPDTINDSPPLWEAIVQLLQMLLLLALLLGPGTILLLRSEDTSALGWACIGFSLFLLPMASLAVIQFDSASGFNPFRWIASIGFTFLPYLGLLLLLAGLVTLIQLRRSLIADTPPLNFVTYGVEIYLMMVLSHLLGRFYFRFDERLRW